jgi:hypothetical protein
MQEISAYLKNPHPRAEAMLRVVEAGHKWNAQTPCDLTLSCECDECRAANELSDRLVEQRTGKALRELDGGGEEKGGE